MIQPFTQSLVNHKEKLFKEQMTTTWNVYRLTDDGFEQSLGYYVNKEDADDAFNYYSEVRYPNAIVDIRELN